MNDRTKRLQVLKDSVSQVKESDKYDKMFEEATRGFEDSANTSILDFDESKVNRHPDGRFAPKGSGNQTGQEEGEDDNDDWDEEDDEDKEYWELEGYDSEEDWVTANWDSLDKKTKNTYNENVIDSYEPWSGAIDHYNNLVNEGKLDTFLDNIRDLEYDGAEPLTHVSLNDLLWHEPETVYEWVGLNSDPYSDNFGTSKMDDDE